MAARSSMAQDLSQGPSAIGSFDTLQCQLGPAVGEPASTAGATAGRIMAELRSHLILARDSNERESVGVTGYRRVLQLVQTLEKANASLKRAFQQAALRGSSEPPGARVVRVWTAATAVESGVTAAAAGCAGFMALLQAASTAQSSSQADEQRWRKLKVAKAFNPECVDVKHLLVCTDCHRSPVAMLSEMPLE
eukprot:SAG31_NODE_1053_length_10144_cov_117.540866_2_plen_193_part_00